MRMLRKILLVLVLAFVLPVVVMGLTAWLAMNRVADRATDEGVRLLAASERERLGHLASEKALATENLLAAYEDDVNDIRTLYEALEESKEEWKPTPAPDLYPGKDKAGLPGFGYVHPDYDAYGDWEKRSDGGPWLRRPLLEKVRKDPQQRETITGQLYRVMRLNPYFARAGRRHKDTMDLVWIVLVGGPTNSYPPYELYEVLKRDPSILDLDETQEDYVRLLGPDKNPSRRTLWLEPYLDAFRGVWMTSGAAPLYAGDKFLGTVGMDILLPTITQEVLRLDPGHGGYAMLLSSSGKLIATTEQGVRDLAWDPVHKRALMHALLPKEHQAWTTQLTESLKNTSLESSPDPKVSALVSAMRKGETGIHELELSGEQKIVAFAPVRSAGWSVAIVLPLQRTVAATHTLRAELTQGTHAILGRFAFYLLAIVATSVVVGFVLHYLTIRPLTRFTQRVEGLAWDNLEFESDQEHRRDEIGQLYQKFHQMIGIIRESRDEVNSKNDDLVREIGERRRAEAALEREKELLDVTLRSIGDAVIATDLDGRITMLNAAAERLTATLEIQSIGIPLSQLLHLTTDSGAEVRNPADSALEQGEPIALANLQLIRAGEAPPRNVAVSGAPILGGDGKAVGAIVVVRDETEERRIEEQMAQLQKLETVKVLAAGIAHDFNNLLTAILGYVSLTRQKLPESSNGRAWLDQAEKAVGRARELTVQLLTFSSGGAPVRRAASLPPILRDASGFALRGAASRCEFEIDPALWPVDVDAGQISQVVQNLVLNADQAMPEGGKVKIKASNAEVGPDQIPLRPGRYVEVSVIDHGTGIPRENLSRIFDPFFTTKSKGSGLGLAVCFSIIKKHGGHIEVESNVGEGTAFRFWLPAASENEAPRPLSSRPPLSSGTGHILIMDDEPAVRDALQQIVIGLGYRVTSTSDGAEAIEAFRKAVQAGRPFDAVVLDMTVPGGMGGKDALESMREIQPSVRAVMTTGYSNDPAASDPAKHGFAAFLAKPYDLEGVAQVLAKVVGRTKES